MSKTPTQAMPREDSPRDSPRNSRGSNENELSFEKYDVDNDRFSTNFGDIESKINADLDTYNELDQNPIFRQLCPKKNWEDKPACKVCNKSFKFMTKKKSCKFCGASICEEHGKKKRPNPENTVEYVRICDICDELHIQKTILGEFKAKLDKKLVAIEKHERDIREQQFKISDSQKEIDDLNLKKGRNDKNYSEQMNFLTNDIAKGKDEIRKCDKDSGEMNKDLQKAQKKVEDLDTELVQSEKEYEKLSKEAIELTNQIEALNQDISQINKTIRNMEEVITAQNKAAPPPVVVAAAPTTTTTTTINLQEETIPVVNSLKNLDSPVKEESANLPVSPSPSETRESIQKPVEPEELAPEKVEAPKPVSKSSMISTTENKRSMAKSSMSQAAPRHVRNSMVQNAGKGANAGKASNCDVGCSMF